MVTGKLSLLEFATGKDREMLGIAYYLINFFPLSKIRQRKYSIFMNDSSSEVGFMCFLLISKLSVVLIVFDNGADQI